MQLERDEILAMILHWQWVQLDLLEGYWQDWQADYKEGNSRKLGELNKGLDPKNDKYVYRGFTPTNHIDGILTKLRDPRPLPCSFMQIIKTMWQMNFEISGI